MKFDYQTIIKEFEKSLSSGERELKSVVIIEKDLSNRSLSSGERELKSRSKYQLSLLLMSLSSGERELKSPLLDCLE